VSLHNDYVRPRAILRLHRPLHRRVLKRAAAIIVAAPDYAQTSPVLHDLQGKVHIVPYGVCTEHYAPLSAVRRPPSVLFAGRLCYYKGVEVLLDAVPAMRVQVQIVGDGAWRARLQRKARQNGVQSRVQFRGALTERDLIAQMHASSVFVFPSTERSEAFGIAQLKAMANGLPVVSTDLPGVRWLNRHGETGLTVPVRDPRALADAVNALRDDPTLRARLADGARARAQSFTVARMMDETQQVYEAVLSRA
ncbi:MAG: glycosyltransferase, partial [Chloroflexi bacterium]|nr:glycosyltransferase [Chloroflexota bacterium]